MKIRIIANIPLPRHGGGEIPAGSECWASVETETRLVREGSARLVNRADVALLLDVAPTRSPNTRVPGTLRARHG